jgi:hypothetical protein
VIRLDSSSLWKVQRARQLDAQQLAAFLGGCELSGAEASGSELTAWRKCKGAAFEAWRAAARGVRRTLKARWALSGEIIARDCRFRPTGVSS